MTTNLTLLDKIETDALGYLKDGIAKTEEKPYFIELGKAVIAKFLEK